MKLHEDDLKNDSAPIKFAVFCQFHFLIKIVKNNILGSHCLFFHCIEASHPSKSGGCFSANSTVMKSDGSRVKLSELKVGDSVLSVNSASGELEFSPIILFLDRDPNEARQFFSVQTESGHSLTLTPTHLIYTSSEADNPETLKAVYAKDIREGDFVLVHDGLGRLKAVRVTDVEMRVHTGVFAPLTEAGNLVVDNVVASCYAVIDSQTLAHAAFAPVRWWSYVTGGSTASADSALSSTTSANEIDSGIHWYARALYSLAEVALPRHLAEP